MIWQYLINFQTIRRIGCGSPVGVKADCSHGKYKNYQGDSTQNQEIGPQLEINVIGKSLKPGPGTKKSRYWNQGTNTQ